jgi:ribosomal-protein-alanine N-acetyltransferase
VKNSDYIVLASMTSADVDTVATLAAECADDAWPASMFQSELECAGSQVWLLKDSGGRLLGFIVLRVVAGVAEIFNVAVSPRHQRCGHGTLLITHAVSQARDADCERVWLEVRESNKSAISLYNQCRFITIGIRPGYYDKGNENAVQMELNLPRKRPNV